MTTNSSLSAAALRSEWESSPVQSSMFFSQEDFLHSGPRWPSILPSRISLLCFRICPRYAVFLFLIDVVFLFLIDVNRFRTLFIRRRTSWYVMWSDVLLTLNSECNLRHWNRTPLEIAIDRRDDFKRKISLIVLCYR